MEFESIKSNHLTSIQQLAVSIAKADDLQSLLDSIVEHIFSQLKSFDCALFLYKPSHQELICYSYRKQGLSEQESFKLKPVQLGSGIIGHTAKTRQTMRVDDTEQNKLFIQDL
ncbi:MAG: GAF domain-containing protein, partial [Kangiella sp.]|nr:GAF domain-containing protein [Kangiella sp.]